MCWGRHSRLLGATQPANLAKAASTSSVREDCFSGLCFRAWMSTAGGSGEEEGREEKREEDGVPERQRRGVDITGVM